MFQVLVCMPLKNVFALWTMGFYYCSQLQSVMAEILGTKPSKSSRSSRKNIIGLFVIRQIGRFGAAC
jgi:hypothetical protein